MRNAEVIRQWQILREIETHRAGVTIHELAERVEVSTRTIRRDLQALQEAGFAVYDEGGEHETKRWRLDDSPFRRVQEGLTVSDVAALFLSRSIVEALSGWPLADELRDAFRKIESALNPRTRDFLATLPDVISTKAGPRAASDAPGLVDVTRRLFDAIRDRRVVTMRYFSATSNRAKSYQVHPYRLALAHGAVYLVAWVPAYDEFRTFAAGRIEHLSVGDAAFKRTRALPDDLFSASMGVFSAPPGRVELEFDAAAAPYVRDRVWHESQQIENLPDGRIRMTLDVSNDWALRSWLLGFGSRVRVLKPAGLAATIREELTRGAEQYR
ncbi:MAG TPA: transcriptional regulator [Vicinamibacterales bacterium]|nr:transcriptional regulator [Vicinamibacterales bacterium]